MRAGDFSSQYMEMENANLCFSTYERPWRTASHKCTHFNIINIIWLPLYHPHCRGFYLPVAAGGAGESLSQRSPGTAASGDGRGHGRHRLHASPPLLLGLANKGMVRLGHMPESSVPPDVPMGRKPEQRPVWAMCIPCSKLHLPA